MSYQASDTLRQEPQTPSVQPGIFNLDTNLDDMSDIIAQPMQPKSPDDPSGMFPGSVKGPQTPAFEVTTPAWDAPDSWDVKEQGVDSLSRLPEIDEGGMPALDEDPEFITRIARPEAARALRRRRRRGWWAFVLGFVLGAIALLIAALLAAGHV